LGRLLFDTYEQAVVAFERTAADAAPIDWITAAINTRASLVQEINGAYLRAMQQAAAPRFVARDRCPVLSRLIAGSGAA
jgi:hypothetical protein